MTNPHLQFKKSTVWHDKRAMKVGMDGVLLGVWASTGRYQRILDVETGAGLITLMLTQCSTTTLDVININSNAYLQAQENITKLPFASRIQVCQTSFLEYTPDENAKCDLIVPNSPYFIDSLRYPDTKRNPARHTNALSLPNLLRDSHKLLAPEGNIALVLPFEQRESLIDIAREEPLSPSGEAYASPTPDAPPKCLLIELSATPVAKPRSSHLTPEIERCRYSKEFTAIARDFCSKI